MSKRTCKDCRNRFSDEGTCPVRFGVSDTDDATNCDTFEPITVFDRITQSPETLAPNFVYHVTSFLDGLDKPKKIWYSTLIHNKSFETELEAKRATVARLKEEVEDARNHKRNA